VGFRPAPLLLGGVVLLAGTTLGACRPAPPPASDVKVDLRVEPQPPREGAATVTVTLTDPRGEPVRGAEVRLEGNMSHPGMQPVFADPTEVRPGVYRGPLEFTMGGDWFIIVTARLPGGGRLEQQVPVPGVKPR
jgi:hypothetical protein